jgi:hypothetical protein
MSMEEIWKKNFIQKNQLLLLLTRIQCKQRYTRTSLPLRITLQCYRSRFKIIFFDFQSFKILYYAGLDIGSE